MITFNDIQKANEQIKTTAIKGKDYAEVNQRIKAFRMVYPTGYIQTRLVSNENGVCVFIAEVGYYSNEEHVIILGTGTAYEKEDSSYINKTSYIENCETSAVGRALGMAGFGIDTSVASYEEVENAITQQENAKPISEHDLMVIQSLLTETNTDAKKVLETYKVNDFKDMTTAQGKKLIGQLNKKRLKK